MPDTEGRNWHIIERIPKLLWGDFHTHTDDLMVASALHLCLDVVGPECSRTYIAGTTGAAFDLGWAHDTLDAAAGGSIFAHPHHFEPGIDNLFRAIGREYMIAYRSQPDRIWDVAVKSLDAGRPVVATEWQIDHFAVLAGYEMEPKTFVGRRYAPREEAPDDYVPIPPDDLGYIVALGRLAEPISERDAALNALRFAVDSARTGTNTDARADGGTGHPMIYGPGAFRDHARLVVDGLDPSDDVYESREHFLTWRFGALALARGYAILYLWDIRELFGEAAQVHIDSAIEIYRTLLGMLAAEGIPGFGPAGPTSEAWERVFFGTARETHVSWDGGRKVETVRALLATRESRRRFADRLVELGDVEARAVAALAQAVEAEQLRPEQGL